MELVRHACQRSRPSWWHRRPSPGRARCTARLCRANVSDRMHVSRCQVGGQGGAPAGAGPPRSMRARAARPSWGRRRPSPRRARCAARAGAWPTMPAPAQAPHCALLVGRPCGRSRLEVELREQSQAHSLFMTKMVKPACCVGIRRHGRLDRQ